jgi:hypothetical protein
MAAPQMDKLLADLDHLERLNAEGVKTLLRLIAGKKKSTPVRKATSKK